MSHDCVDAEQLGTALGMMAVENRKRKEREAVFESAVFAWLEDREAAHPRRWRNEAERVLIAAARKHRTFRKAEAIARQRELDLMMDFARGRIYFRKGRRVTRAEYEASEKKS